MLERVELLNPTGRSAVAHLAANTTHQVVHALVGKVQVIASSAAVIFLLLLCTVVDL